MPAATSTRTRTGTRARPLRGSAAKKGGLSVVNGNGNGSASRSEIDAMRKKIRKPANAIERDHAERLHELPEEFLRCRDLRHAMEPVGAWRRGLEVHRTVACVRCGTERVDVWRLDTGARETAKYKYAEGYQVQGLGQIMSFEVRKEVLGRVKIYESAEDMEQALLGGGKPRKRRSS